MTASQIIVGTRGSLLATTQTGQTVDALRTANPGVLFDTRIIETTGDMQRDRPFASVGTKGMFVKEIEQALLDGSIHIGVHSLKDMPGELPEGLALACVPSRVNPLDAFVSVKYASLEDMPLGAVLGTSSARRKAQMLAIRPDLQVVELRGNLDTRLRKLDEGLYDGILLACAGLIRLGAGSRITQQLSPEVCLPAVGQGALAIEARIHDEDTHTILQSIHCPDTADCARAERALLAAMGGGCSVPLAAHASIKGDEVVLNALAASTDGLALIKASAAAPRYAAHMAGLEAARLLKEQGAAALLAAN
jgi:hydroxymethylbilane synthase